MKKTLDRMNERENIQKYKNFHINKSTRIINLFTIDFSMLVNYHQALKN